MAERTWYFAVNGRREGPIADAQLRDRIARGEIGADTLVWCEGMTNWARAGDVPGLIPGALSTPATGAPAPGITHGITHGLALDADLPVWPLFGRSLLMAIGQFLVIPSPWTSTSFYQWMVSRIRLPTGEQASFAGRPGDIWYIFILNALCGYSGAYHGLVPLLITPLTALFSLIIIRWFFANLVRPRHVAPLKFIGSYWALLGWSLLGWISFFTIIGWAWVFTAALRWLCRNVQGSSRQLSFEGSGWGLLWRSFAFALSCIFIIPIPWTGRWYARWMISQFSVGTAAGQTATQ